MTPTHEQMVLATAAQLLDAAKGCIERSGAFAKQNGIVLDETVCRIIVGEYLTGVAQTAAFLVKQDGACTPQLIEQALVKVAVALKMERVPGS